VAFSIETEFFDFISLRERLFGAGKGIRTLDPNLGNFIAQSNIL
jgi:hypothetical protein